jgi:deoxycytidylate deaminase
MYYLSMLPIIASRATCPRRRVAAILVDEGGKLVAIGYNGPPAGMKHCIDVPCPGATDPGGDTSRCRAIHAEMNALSQARASRRLPHTLYCSTTPCFTCAKLLITEGVRRVVAASDYQDRTGVELLGEAGVAVEVLEPAPPRPRIVCLCGSTRFKEAFDEANYTETMAGNIVLSVGFFMHATGNRHGDGVGCTPEQKVALDALHKRKIDLADEVLVLDVGQYIGDSTRSEVEHAVRTGKPVRWLDEPGPALKEWFINLERRIK